MKMQDVLNKLADRRTVANEDKLENERGDMNEEDDIDSFLDNSETTYSNNSFNMNNNTEYESIDTSINVKHASDNNIEEEEKELEQLIVNE